MNRLATTLLFALCVIQPAAGLSDSPEQIRVAVVQMHSSHKLQENVDNICCHLAESASKGARVAVFPECATTGYFKDDIPRYTEQDFLKAERRIADACRRHNIYAVVGTPYPEEGTVYNMGLVIDPAGRTILRQPKINLAASDIPWSVPGNRLGLFMIDGELCSILICHDSRYPELVRLPVMKGARLVFYVSCEGNITLEDKIEPHRAQVGARAVENSVFVVQSNTPQRVAPFEGSHGQSRIVDPKGTILQEASIFKEEVLMAVLDLRRASGYTAKRSLESPFVQSWWNQGLQLVSDPEP